MLLEEILSTGACPYWGCAFLMDEIVGEAVDLLEAMPWYATVFVTSGNVSEILQMQAELDEYIVTAIKFVTPSDILDRGALRGRIGVLLIKDQHLIHPNVLHCIKQERDSMDVVLRRDF